MSMVDYARSRPQCEVQGCPTASINATTQLCPKHWHRLYRHGDVHAEHDDVGAESGHGLFGVMSRGEDWVLCHECGKTFKNLGSHLKATHHMTAADYRDAHGLASSDALMCDSMRRKIGKESTERIGTEAWAKFAARRDETIGQTQKLAASAAKRAGARASHAVNAARNAPGAREWRCNVCGVVVPSGRATCSKACADVNRRVGVGRRDARRKGEAENFVRRPGQGKKLFQDDVLARLGVSDVAFRSRVKRGQFVAYAGRDGWLPFWWESDVHRQENAKKAPSP